jgi:hypothetical protein
VPRRSAVDRNRAGVIRSSSGIDIVGGFDGEAFRRLAATTTLPHRDVSGLEVTAEPIRVKERMGCAIVHERRAASGITN